MKFFSSFLIVVGFTVAAFTFAGCSAGSDSATGPSTGTSGSGALIVPNLDFGALPPGQSYDRLIAISNASGDYLTITKNGTMDEAKDTNFRQPIVLTPHGYKLI